MTLGALITHVQVNIGVTGDGIAGPKTWKAIYKKLKGTQPPDDLGDLISEIQQQLNIAVDGNAGKDTWTAISNAIKPVVSKAEPVTGNATDAVDSRSEKSIGTLLPEVQPLARLFVRKAAAAGVTIKIISGLRTYAEQDALYAQGRTKPGPKVTNAKG